MRGGLKNFPTPNPLSPPRARYKQGKLKSNKIWGGVEGPQAPRWRGEFGAPPGPYVIPPTPGKRPSPPFWGQGGQPPGGALGRVFSPKMGAGPLNPGSRLASPERLPRGGGKKGAKSLSVFSFFFWGGPHKKTPWGGFGSSSSFFLRKPPRGGGWCRDPRF